MQEQIMGLILSFCSGWSYKTCSVAFLALMKEARSVQIPVALLACVSS